MNAALLAIALAASSHLSVDELKQLQKDVPAHVSGALAQKLQEARKGARPTVANVRARLKALRELETEARKILATDPESVWTHKALALAWGELAQLEGALGIDGEGDGPEREAVRSMAQQRAEDADAIAASEAAHDAEPPTAALQACWGEHLLRVGGQDSLELIATIADGVTFKPALVGPRVPLGECLSTRLLRLSRADAELELPLHFTTR